MRGAADVNLTGWHLAVRGDGVVDTYGIPKGFAKKTCAEILCLKCLKVPGIRGIGVLSLPYRAKRRFNLNILDMAKINV